MVQPFHQAPTLAVVDRAATEELSVLISCQLLKLVLGIRLHQRARYLLSPEQILVRGSQPLCPVICGPGTRMMTTSTSLRTRILLREMTALIGIQSLSKTAGKRRASSRVHARVVARRMVDSSDTLTGVQRGTDGLNGWDYRSMSLQECDIEIIKGRLFEERTPTRRTFERAK